MYLETFFFFVPSSPRKRGCFPFLWHKRRRVRVFPAQAGVFPPRARVSGTVSGLPRASGGVSIKTADQVFLDLSSPRKRGCFQTSESILVQVDVFPAQAGVFLRFPSSSKL